MCHEAKFYLSATAAAAETAAKAASVLVLFSAVVHFSTFVLDCLLSVYFCCC